MKASDSTQGPRIPAVFRPLWSRLAGDASARWMPWALAVFAVLYYALYANAGLNLGGEGGTAGVVAQRLMAGQRPLVDTFLGYNVLWFYPVAGLFELTSPNYLALRWYFFAFCTASGLLVYFVVHRYTRNAWFSAIPAVMAILVPGMIFRNYMPFLGILNAFLLTRAWVVRRDSAVNSLAWMAGAGAGLGVTFLFRIDLGVFCTAIFLGLAVLYPFGEKSGFPRRLVVAVMGVVAGLLLAWAVHLPVWKDAVARGYDRAFLGQYTAWVSMIGQEFRQQMADLLEDDRPVPAGPPAPESATPEAVPVAPDSATPPPSPARPNADSWEDRGALARAPLSDVIHARKWVQKSFVLSSYLPLLISVVAILGGGLVLLAALVRRDAELKERALYPLTVLGCALTLLPQFLFFRPDTPHLSEMMVPFLAALALWFWAAGKIALAAGSAPLRWGTAGFAGLCAVAAGIYFSHGIAKESAGSIAANRGATQLFRALNGVSVRVKPRDAEWLVGLRDAVIGHSAPGEHVLCLPYSPTINFLADRPSPLYNLYVDNATAGDGFQEAFLALIKSANPPVVVIDQRRINKNEFSRFSAWAPGPYAWLREHYVYYGRYFRSEVFIRPDKVTAPVTPQAVHVEN